MASATPCGSITSVCGRTGKSPTPRRKAALERDFERLFPRRTGFVDLNEALQRIHGKRDDLLLVLERPEIPLHNNLSESDIREWAKKRKISAGTRSELGRRCRDTFISLKKTCRKLGVSFWRYLQDRIRGRTKSSPCPTSCGKRPRRHSLSRRHRSHFVYPLTMLSPCATIAALCPVKHRCRKSRVY